VIERLIGDRAEIWALYEPLKLRRPGGANNPLGSNQHRKADAANKADVVNVDNVRIDQEGRPTGNTLAAGIRKLQKHAAEGNEDAIRELGEVEAGRKPARQSGYGHAGTQRQDAKA
jgi:hypothetical protein